MLKQIKSFFNTTKLNGEELKKEIDNAKTVNAKVLEIFKLKHELAAIEVISILECNNYRVNESSVRRSVTNLYNAGVLEKTENTIISDWGKRNYKYKIKKS